MLDINYWFFVQLVNFLVLLYVLNLLLFRPLLRQLKERDDRITGYLDQSKDMEQEKNDLMQKLEAKLASTRDSAKEVFEGLRSEGLEAQKRELDSAREDAEQLSKDAREKLEAAAAKAREALRGDVESFARKIVEKMVRT
jgi:F-type H+-transporting ATPase subunit b